MSISDMIDLSQPNPNQLDLTWIRVDSTPPELGPI